MTTDNYLTLKDDIKNKTWQKENPTKSKNKTKNIKKTGEKSNKKAKQTTKGIKTKPV